MKHLLSIADMTRETMMELLEQSIAFKREFYSDERHQHLKGKTLTVLVAEEDASRKILLEASMCQLGGTATFLSLSDAQKSALPAVMRWVDGIAVRGIAQQKLEEFAKFSQLPLVNLGSDQVDLLAALAGLMCMREHKGYLDGLHLCYVGEGNAAANTLIVGALRMGMQVSVSTPAKTPISDWTHRFAQSYGGRFRYVQDAQTAANDADVVFTDCWKGTEKADSTYQIHSQLLKNCASDVMVLHLSPEKCGREMESGIFEDHKNQIFRFSENLLYVQKAMLVHALT